MKNLMKYIVAALIGFSFNVAAVDPDLPPNCGYLLKIKGAAPDFDFAGMNQKIVTAEIRVCPDDSVHKVGDVIEIIPSMCVSMEGTAGMPELENLVAEFVACYNLYVGMTNTAYVTAVTTSSSSQAGHTSIQNSPARKSYMMLNAQVVPAK
jgi:hypothetical protein